MKKYRNSKEEKMGHTCVQNEEQEGRKEGMKGGREGGRKEGGKEGRKERRKGGRKEALNICMSAFFPSSKSPKSIRNRDG